MIERKRYDLEKILKQCKENNLEFIEIISGLKNKVKVKCLNCNIIFERTMDKWNIRQNCTNCNKKRSITNNLDVRKNNFIKYLDTTEFEYISGFKDDHTKVLLKHIPCGKNIEITPNHLKNNRGCRYCNGGVPYTDEIFQEKFFEKHNKKEYTLLDKYTGSKKPIRIKHENCGLIFTVNDPTRVSNLGTGCPYCSGAVKKPISLIKDEIKKINNGEYILFDEFYEKGYVNLKHKCGTVYNVLLSNFLLNKSWGKCPSCYPVNKSIGEIEVKEFIESLGFKTKTLRKTINNKNYEVDIFIENLNIGFEFNGLYWHSDSVNASKYNINEKRKAYESIGIRIVNIFEDEWKFKKDIVKNKIKSILNKNYEKTIYARMCSVQKITSKERNIFLRENHIQGEDRASLSYGLFFNEELIAVISLTKLRPSLGQKNKKDNTYELSRYATKYHVPGGFSKLFKNIISQNSEIEYIITYADLRWSDSKNNVYLKNNFIQKNISEPGYWYFNPSSLMRYHRYNFRKQVLKEKFPDIYNENLTEHQIMDKTKYRRIWDCGNLVYEWRRKDS